MNLTATAPLLLRQYFRSPAFVTSHLLVWLWFLYSRANSGAEGSSVPLKVELYAVFIGLYLGSSVLSSEYQTRNVEIVFLRGIPAASWYWTRWITLAFVGMLLVCLAGGLLLLSDSFSGRGLALLLRACLHFLLTCSLCFFFGSFVHGYANSVLAFLFKLLSAFLASASNVSSQASSVAPPVWGFFLPPTWHVGAIGRSGEMEWHALGHVLPVLTYCFLTALIGMVFYRKFGSRLLSR